MEHYENQTNSDTFDGYFNTVIIIACLLLAALVGCCAGYAYAQRRLPATILSQEQLLRQNYANGIYADELADWHDQPKTKEKNE